MVTTALAGGISIDDVSPGTALALAPLVVLSLGLLGYCLVDIARSPRVRHLPKPVWVLIVIILNAPPLGSLAYLVWGRVRDDSSAAGLDAEEIAELASERREGGTGA